MKTLSDIKSLYEALCDAQIAIRSNAWWIPSRLSPSSCTLVQSSMIFLLPAASEIWMKAWVSRSSSSWMVDCSQNTSSARLGVLALPHRTNYDSLMANPTTEAASYADITYVSSLRSHLQFKIQDFSNKFDPLTLIMHILADGVRFLCWGNSAMLLQCFTRVYSGIQILILLCKGVPVSRQKMMARKCLYVLFSRWWHWAGWRWSMAEKMVLGIFVAVLPTDTELKLLSSSLLEGAMCYRRWNPWTKAIARAFPFWMLYLFRKVRGQQKWTCYI